jgi:hypothetical protein
LIAGGELPWLSVEQMREVNRIMVDDLGISLVRMMENAGRNLAELARHVLGGDTEGQAVAVLVGPGGKAAAGWWRRAILRPQGHMSRSRSPRTTMRLRRFLPSSSRSHAFCRSPSTAGPAHSASRLWCSTRCSVIASTATRAGRRQT